MLTTIDKLLVLGVLLVVPLVGCKNSRRSEPDWAREMARETTYEVTDSRSGYVLPAAHEWVCPMHVQIKQSQPGRCSICGMNLVSSDELSRTGGSSSGSEHSHSAGSHSKGSGGGCCGG